MWEFLQAWFSVKVRENKAGWLTVHITQLRCLLFSKGNNFRKIWTNSFTVVRSAPGLLPSCHLPSDAPRAAPSTPSPVPSQGTSSKKICRWPLVRCTKIHLRAQQILQRPLLWQHLQHLHWSRAKQTLSNPSQTFPQSFRFQ